MRRRAFVGVMVALMMGVVAAPFVATASDDDERKLVVVVNRDNDVSNIDLEDLRDLYLGKRRFWANRSRVRAVDLIEKKTSEEKTAYTRFAQSFLGKNPAALKNYWIKMIFSGAGQPPKQLVSAAEVIEYIANDEGGIGYLYADQVTDEVRVVAISRPER